MNIFLIRHAKTLSNLRGAFTGKNDEQLSEQGTRELKGRVYPAAELVFSSPMRRCIDAAKLIYPMKEPVIIENLRERDFGDFEGKTHVEIIALPGFSNWGMNEQSMDFPGGEDFTKFMLRSCAAFLEALKQIKFANASDAAVVCHGGVIMAILSELAVPKRKYFDWQCKNGEGYILSCKGESIEVKGRIGF